MKIPFLLLICWLFAFAAPVGAQTLQLVQDARLPEPALFESASLPFKRFKNKIYFNGHTVTPATSGLWEFDGDQANLINKIGVLSELYEADTGYFIMTQISEKERVVWKTDGDICDFRRLDTITLPGQFYPIQAGAFKNSLVYSHVSPDIGRELWVSDGTLAGTKLLYDCLPGPAWGDPVNFIAADSLVFFLAKDAQGNQLLWRTNGTPQGTFPITSAFPTGTFWVYEGMRSIGGKLFYLIQKNGIGTELWTSDGSVQGAVKVSEIPNLGQFTSSQTLVLNDKFLFTWFNADFEVEWWTSDGTAAGTMILHDLGPIQEPLFPEYYLRQPAIIKGKLYFFTDKGLWSTDGTPTGTTFINYISSFNALAPLPATDQYLFFLMQTDDGTLELWRSDGKPTGTMFLKNVGTSEYQLTINKAISATAGSKICVEVEQKIQGSNFSDWRIVVSDGKIAGTHFLEGALSPELAHSKPSGFVATTDNEVFFRTERGYLTESIWHVNSGVSDGAELLGSLWSDGLGPYSSNEKAYWVNRDSNSWIGVWEPGLPPAKIPLSVWPGSSAATKAGSLVFQDRYGKSLWLSDGSPAGTAEFFQTSANGSFKGLVSISDSIFFIETNSGNVYLWTTDGTPSGTFQLDSLTTTSGNVVLYNINGRVAFEKHSDDLSGRQLYIRGFGRVDVPGYHSTRLAGYELTDDHLFVMGQRDNPGPYKLWVFKNGIRENIGSFAALSYEYISYSTAPSFDLLHGLPDNTVIFSAYQLQLPAKLTNGVYWLQLYLPGQVLVRPLVILR